MINKTRISAQTAKRKSVRSECAIFRILSFLLAVYCVGRHFLMLSGSETSAHMKSQVEYSTARLSSGSSYQGLCRR